MTTTGHIVEVIRAKGRIPRAIAGYLARQHTVSGRTAQASALRVLAQAASGQPDPTQVYWPDLSAAHVSGLVAWSVENRAPATAARYRSALLGLLRACWQEGLLTQEQLQRLEDAAPPVSVQTRPAGRALTPDELAQLEGVCTTARDFALVGLLFGLGLRREEVTKVRLRDLSPHPHQWLPGVIPRITVRGKGHRVDELPVGPTAIRLLRKMVQADPGLTLPDFLVPRCGDDGQRVRLASGTPRGLTVSGVSKVFSALVERAGLADLTPHDGRRTFCTRALKAAGGDLLAAQRLTRHQDLKTLQRYDRRPEEDAEALAGKL